MNNFASSLAFILLCTACGDRFVSSEGAAGSTSNGGDTNAGGDAGASLGGSTSSSGSAGAGTVDCGMLELAYRAALDKARQCDRGSAGQCSPSSTLPALGCGCPVLVNAKSEATTTARRRYDAIQAANCDGGALCGIACAPYLAASCSSQSMSSGALCSAPGAVD